MATNGKAYEYTNAVAVYDETFQIPGMETMDRSDMVLPRVRLVQAQSQFSNEAGMLHNSLIGTTAPEIKAVFIGVRKGRVMWPEKFERGQDPECASDDALAPRPDMPYGYAGVCADCPMSAWGNDGAAPLCGLSYNFLGLNLSEDDLPFLVSFTRTSAKAGKQLITLLSTMGMKRAYVLSVEQQTNNFGKFYVLKVGPGDPLTPEQQRHYAAKAAQFAGVKITSDTEAPEGEDARAKEDEKIPF